MTNKKQTHVTMTQNKQKNKRCDDTEQTNTRYHDQNIVF